MSGVLPARTEAEVLAGVIVVPFHRAGVEKELPVLTIAESRAWKRALASAMAGRLAGMRLDGIEDGGEVAVAASDTILELVVAYDVRASLGGREWLEANATDGEVYSTFRRCLEVSFPFVKDLRTALVELRAIGLADLLGSGRSQAERSTSDSVESSDSDLLATSSGS